MSNIDEYIQAQDPAIQERLCEIRNAIATAIPDAGVIVAAEPE